MNRTKAREQAFLLVFEKAFREESMQELMEYAVEAGLYQNCDFSDGEAFGVSTYLDEIDGVIQKYIKNWSIDRLSKVSLAILRLAVYELQYVNDIPESVSINEAVELAKQFGSEDDAKYINGVLSSVVKCELL